MPNTLIRDFSEDGVKDSYSKVAWFYDGWSWLTESKAAKRVIDLADIKSGEQILEVAVGTGLVFREILKKNPNGVNKGTDISPSMLDRAIKRMEKLNMTNYELTIGNAYQLPFEDNSFDLVINNFMIDLLPEADFNRILSEFKRVLTPSGRVVISTMAFGEKWHNTIWHWVANVFPDLLTGCRPVSIGDHLKGVGFHVERIDQISQWTFPSEVVCARK
ncbi:MAG: class I SAM-dependent methyltransferase [Fidelibacterota bacterium]